MAGNRAFRRQSERRPARKIRIHGHDGEAWANLLGRIRERLQRAGGYVSQERVEREAMRLEQLAWRLKKHPNRDRLTWWWASQRSVQ